MKDNTIETQGRLADARLATHKLRLTQGGELTCVPCNPIAPEWNVAAVGPQKLDYARRMARHLVKTLFRGAVILLSPGKQYPGEPHPRWQLGLHRRRRGAPLWKEPNRLRLDQTQVPAATEAAARKLIKDLARALKLTGPILPAYEDFEAHLRAWEQEGKSRLLPRFSRRKCSFVTPTWPKSLLADSAEKLRPAGWVLPLSHDGRRWHTDRWALPRGECLTLLAGESPVGLRLPLDRLDKDALRTALTVEVKAGELLVFLPPMPSFAAFGELTGIIEDLAVRLQLPPLCLEGYPPPEEGGVDSIAMTSDPGVIEVNLPPRENWPQFERVIRGVFHAMEKSGLRAYKYQENGRKVSTGGGAHILLGGPGWTHNPFLQRPTLLSSFLRFFQNHPSLSYVFSGLFTGPSCQAPRVDESVSGLPDELEITLRAIEAMPRPGDPSQMDAMLRNLLMDWNGNTHRAELSVDKFHNWDAPNGRLGVVEFRAFEMPPRTEMLLSVNALVRSLAACFADRPYAHPLIDWRGALHDRFALPWCLRQDLKAVLDFVNEHGFHFDPAWFEPHLDFRFPMITHFRTGKVVWTIRHALEPWPVMGEHTGTGRIVDSTTDRLEIHAAGLPQQNRWAVHVNDHLLRLVRVGRGEALAAVRYRLFDNPWGLQPQVKSHSPLRFEIVDTRKGRIAHAFEYHNWKSDDPGSDNLPTSEEEARQRVAQRVAVRPNRVGRPASRRAVPASRSGSFTLDLRRG